MQNSIPQSSFWIYLCIILLPFNGGYINAMTLMSYLHNSVGYVTGNIAFAGDFFVHKEYALFLNMLLLILCFIFGAFLSGILIKSEHYHKDYRYDLNLGLQAIFVFIAMNGMLHGHAYTQYLLAMTMGLQNAMTTHYSSALIRTTHMTGTATDLGILLAHAFKGKASRPWLIKIYSILIVCFLFGAICGAITFFHVAAYGLLLPLLIYFIMIFSRKL